MLKSDSPEHVAHYVSTGLSALENIAASLTLTNRSFADVHAALIFPSGYGRVIRHLVQFIKPERITACDIDRQAVRFCAREFDVTGLISNSTFSRILFPQNYDLIFVGSLLTHLAPAAGIDLLDSLVRVLAPRAQLIFTTQGASCLEHLDWYGPSFKAAEVFYREALTRTGTAFKPYPGRPSYGITIHAKRHVEALIDARFPSLLAPVRFAERGWATHQDVWSYTRL
jgi:hypothetical protein